MSHPYYRGADDFVARERAGFAECAKGREAANAPEVLAQKERMRLAAQRASQFVEMERNGQRANFQPHDVPLRESQGWTVVPVDPTA